MATDKKVNSQTQALAEGFGVDEIQSIVEMLKANDITEFRLEKDGGKLFLKRSSLDAPPAQNVISVPPNYFQQSFQQPTYQQPVGAPQQYPPAPQAQGVTPSPTAEAPAASAKLHELKSPMVGTFYKRPAVDADPYAQIGSTVKKGQVLCIIEAMKIMNEIEADVSGKLMEVCLEDGRMAEYGEVLFRIEPSA
jgi:acetyl-CoA carboxylase biotin carboxyl carrier protein